MPKSLYICYFGVREPLVRTQVIPYLLEIGKDDVAVSLLTFEPDFKEKWTPEQIAAMRSELAAKGVDWHCLAYHKRLSVVATAWDILCGTIKVWKLNRKELFDILHCRVHVPGVMAGIARKFSSNKPKILFDIRGFFPEEFVDAGIWPENGLIFRTVKRVEKWLMKEADGFVVLTENARGILFPESKETGCDKFDRPVEVIPCCVDLKKFESATPESRQRMREELKIGERNVIAYVGSFGGWYMTQEIADFYKTAKKKDAATFAMVLTQSKPEMIEPLLRDAGFGNGEYLITRVTSDDIPVYLSAADAAVSFVMPSYSKRASSPTKNAEYLACGLPIVLNDGIGDSTEFAETDETGVVIADFSEETFEAALDELKEMSTSREALAERCKRSARERFDLVEVGGKRYRRLYQALMGKRG